MRQEDKNELISLLDQALKVYRSSLNNPSLNIMPSQIKAMASLLSIPTTQIDHCEQQIIDFISRSLLKYEPTIDEFDGRLIPFSNRGGSSKSLEGLRSSILNRAMEVGSSQVVREFESYLSHETFTARQMIAITGVHLEKKAELDGGIIIEPVNGFDNQYEHRIAGHDERSALWNSFMGIEPQALIVKEIEHPRFFGSRLPEIDSKGLYIGVPDLWDFTELEDACRFLSLIGPSGPIAFASSLWSTKWVPALGGPLGTYPHHVEIMTTVDLSQQSIQQYETLYNKYRKLPEDMRHRLRIPLERLNRAMRRHDRVDAAIDIGIALESLFADDKPFDSSILFTMRLRAARFLRNNKDERIDTANLVRDIYSLRSKGAHTGILPKNSGTKDSNTTIQLGANLVAESIIKIIEQGQPDWNELIYM